MPIRVATALADYLELGSRRSLVRLAEHYGHDGPSIATLKRWSPRYCWREHAEAHDRAFVAAMDVRLRERAQQQICNELEAIAAAKERFYERVVLDPDDPALTPAQRRRALEPTLADFGRLLKLERMLLPQLAEDRPKTPDAGGEEKLQPHEIAAMLEALNRVRHNTP